MSPPQRVDLDAVRAQLATVDEAERVHPLGLRVLADAPGAVGALPDLIADLCRPGSPVAVLAAATSIRMRGCELREVVEDALGARFEVRWRVIGPSDGRLHADEPTVAAAAHAAHGAACVLTVGSGTLTDIGKAAAPAAAPLVCVQTATSVNGYADPFSVLLRNGVKRTTPTRWPDALVIDPDVLLSAPADLNRAGLGDEVAMFTASADWYLASALDGAPGGGAPSHPGDDPAWHAAIAWLTRVQGDHLGELAGRLSTAEGLTGLARILTLSGIAMGVAGSTAPASGMEHAISHLLEMAADARGEPGSLHGAQVGVSSIVAAATWALVRARGIERGLAKAVRLPDPDEARDQIERAFAWLDPTGAMAAECFAGYAVKLRGFAAGAAGAAGASGSGGLARLRDSWPAHDAVLGELLAEPPDIRAALADAGLPVTFGQLDGPVSAETARWAVAVCGLQRRRVGVADLAMLLGAWQDDDIDQVLADAGVLT
jgi:glycerol-1-phosphate dehydrogenase [NAD(P)+]